MKQLFAVNLQPKNTVQSNMHKPLMLVFCVLLTVQPAKCTQIQFDYNVDSIPVDSKPSKPQSVNKQTERDKKDTSSSTSDTPVAQHKKKHRTIAFDARFLRIDDGDEISLLDFEKRRAYVIDSKEKTYLESSLYADLGFRIPEIQNRAMLSQILDSAGITAHSNGMDVFNNESVFGLITPPEFLKMIAKVAKDSKQKSSDFTMTESPSGAMVFTHENEVVCSLKSSKSKLTPAEAAQFSRFLIYFCRIHPNIRKIILAKGAVPEELSFRYQEAGRSMEEGLKLTRISQQPGKLSLPEGLQQKHRKLDPLEDIYKALDKAGNKPPSDLANSTIQFIDKAIADHRPLDALLAAIEYKLQTGQTLDVDMERIRNKGTLDPQFALFYKGMDQPKSAEEAKTCLAALDDVAREKLIKGYLIDVFRANVLRSMQMNRVKDIETNQEKSPAKCFIKVLEANPFLTGAYHDLGNCLYSAYDTAAAWECWDLGRSFYPNHFLMKDIDEMEQKMVEQHPEFFDGEK